MRWSLHPDLAQPNCITGHSRCLSEPAPPQWCVWCRALLLLPKHLENVATRLQHLAAVLDFLKFSGRRPANDSPWQQQRELSLMYARFYGALLIGIVFTYQMQKCGTGQSPDSLMACPVWEFWKTASMTC